MAGVAVAGVDVAGGVQLGGGQSRFSIDGHAVVVVGDPVQSHGNSPHNSPVMVTGSDWFTIDGKKVCRQGDMASCGHSSTGRPWFDIP